MDKTMTTHTQNIKRSSDRRRRHRPKPAELAAVIVLLTLICILGFILTSGLIANLNNGSADASAIASEKGADPTATATPFQPEENGDQPELTPDPEIAQTPTEKVLQKPEGQINVLLLGSDARPGVGGFRTDVIMWVSLNPKDGFASVISFPRDLYVNIPGYGYNRINTAYTYGGFDLLASTLESNFGVRPDQYILIDFNGFKAIINDLGGVNVQTARNLSDTCAKWINPSGYCSVGPGQVHMNGEVALWYARSRYSTNDVDRARRAQEVGEAIFRRLVSLDALVRAPDLYNSYITYVQTNVGVTDVVALLPLARKLNDNGDIRNYVVDYNYAYDWITSAGAQVLIPDYGAIEELMIEALNLQ